MAMMSSSGLIAVLTLTLLAFPGEAFLSTGKRLASSNGGALEAKRTCTHKNNGDIGRGAFLQSVAVLQLPIIVANAAEISEKVTKLTQEEAEQRFREGYKSFNYLLDHYDEICEGGGDNVRRYLGTVGTKSGLVGIDKTMKALEDRAEDLVDYTETSQEIVKCINQADGSSYMAIFVTTSSSSTPPEKYFNDAKIEVKRGIKAMNDLATMIDLKL